MDKLIVVIALVLAVLVGLWLPAHADGPVSPMVVPVGAPDDIVVMTSGLVMAGIWEPVVGATGTPEDIAIVAPGPVMYRIGMPVVCVGRGEK